MKLESGKTNIYVKGQLFRCCKFLTLNIPVERISSFEEIESVDEVAEKQGQFFKGISAKKLNIPPEVEFWGHCSNLQVWAENNYNTRLLHHNLIFPLLYRLTHIGDPIAIEVFKEEIAKTLFKW